jgi:hypothetical protein
MEAATYAEVMKRKYEDNRGPSVYTLSRTIAKAVKDSPKLK